MSAPVAQTPQFVAPVGSTLTFTSTGPVTYAATVVGPANVDDMGGLADYTNNNSAGWKQQVATGQRQMKIDGLKLAWRTGDANAPALAAQQLWTIAVSPPNTAAFVGAETFTANWWIKQVTHPVFDFLNGYTRNLSIESDGPVTLGAVTGS